MSARWTSATILGATLLTGTISGCGGTASHTPRPRHSSAAKTLRQLPPDEQQVAERTRKATRTRRADWGPKSDKVEAVAALVAAAATENQLSEDLIYGIIWVESRFNPLAVSSVGARGLMQLMPRTADYLGDCIDWRGRYNAFAPEFNIAAGSYYIARLIDEFHGDEALALAAYNAGPTKVRRWLAAGGLPAVSVEYVTMVQTARGFFHGHGQATPSGPARTTAPLITDGELDRLGLAILIAGLSDKQFGLEREDTTDPFAK